MRKSQLAGLLAIMLLSVLVVLSGFGSPSHLGNSSEHSGAVAETAETSDNLLENPGLEAVAQQGAIPGWTPVSQGGAALSSSKYYSGRQSLQVEDVSDSENGGAWSVVIAARPGDKFRSEAFVRVEQGSAILYMEFVNAAGQHHSYATPWTSGPTSGGWVPAKVEGTVPEGAAGVRMLPYSGAKTTCLCYFDDITLVKKGESPMKQRFGPVQTIPDAVLNKLGQSAALGTGQDGKAEAYFFANGAPGTFYALDAATGEKRFSRQVTGASIVWAMTRSSNGNVYFASSENGRLFRYSPNERNITDLGVNPSGSFVWDIDATPDGRYLYGAVYPQGKMFEYDTQTSAFKDLGTMKQGKEYVRGLGVTDRYVYSGLGTFADAEPRIVVRYDRETGAKTDIVIPSASTFINDVQIYGGKLFIASGSVYVVDESTLKPVDTFSYGGQISPPYPEQQSLVYFTSGNKIFSYRLDTGIRQEAGTLPSLASTSMKTLGWVRPAAGQFAGKSVLSGVTSYGDSFLFDPASGKAVEVRLDVAGSPVQTHSMKAGPDGKLYLGGYHQGVSVYDPSARSFLVHQYHTLQPESVGFLNGKVYFGMYGGAQIFKYDPAKPWQYGTAAGNNPYRAYDIREQDRPYVFASGDNKLFVGTIPDYGHLGGKLTVYDEAANTWKEYDNSRLVRNQSITGLAYRNGKLYGSTTVKGGLGISPTETEAKLFIWDVATERKIAERPLNLPGHKPPMIGNLAFGPDGLLWGATGSAIFALDPDTLDTVKSRALYSPELDKSGSWRPFDLLFGEDGYIYSTIGLAITVIDPKTLEFDQLAPKAGVIALGSDGSVYYSLSGKDIYRIPIKLQSVHINGYKPILPLSGTLSLRPEGVLANGKPADLQAAAVRYSTSNPQVLTVAGNGLVTAHSAGDAEVRAEVTLDGTTIVSESMKIKVSR